MLTIRAISNGQGYDSRHLVYNDYYSENEKVLGQWFGKGAEMLGLSGGVTHESFEAIRQGNDPQAGEFLRERHSADRTAADGAPKTKARHLYDFTFSAPKSVSVVAQLADDERLVEAHRRAVDVALRELEVHSAARVRAGGMNEDRTTGNLVLATYQHDTSRELDPQIHTHCVAGNLTWDDAEQKWKALSATPVYERRAYLSEVYRNVLAADVMALGYTIYARHDSKGNDAGFEITGVPRELLEKYSRRSAQRDQAIQEFVLTHGRQPTDNEVATLVRDTRQEKLTEITTPEVRRQQRERLTIAESRLLAGLRAGIAPVPVEQIRAGHSAVESLQHGEEHVFERVSVAKDYEVYTEALRHGRGRIELADLQEGVASQIATGAAFRFKSDLATQASLERERGMVEIINRGIAAHAPLGAELTPDERLTPEQIHALAFILASRDFAVNLRGAAGTGKTRALQELRRGLVAAGRQVMAFAPSVSAVDELRKVGFDDAQTLASLLENPAEQVAARGKVVILDEAGMVSAREMAEFLAAAERNSMRVVFVGDTKQLRSVEAGDALRILERDSQLQSTSLTRVQRQVQHEYREAIQELRTNPRRGFDRLVEMGAVQEVHLLSRAEAVQQAYVSAVSEHKDVLVVAATHDELNVVTAAIRKHRKESGELIGSTEIDRHVPLNYTLAQKKDASRFVAGQLLVFHRKSKTIQKHEVLEVTRTEGRVIYAKDSAGYERRVIPSQAAAFQVFERKALDVGPNDRILLMENRRGKVRVTNGELATVTQIDSAGQIHLEDGRILPSNYRQIDHGYAITTHRSQGKTVDAVVISADAMRRELFYVAASRGRQSLTVVTSNVQGLRESVAITGDRASATELHRLIGNNGNFVHSHRQARRRAHQNARQLGFDHNAAHTANSQRKGHSYGM